VPQSLSIKHKLGFAILFAMIVGLLVAGSAFTYRDYGGVRDTLMARAASHARRAALASAAAVASGDRRAAEGALHSLDGDRAIASGRIDTPTERGFASFEPGPADQDSASAGLEVTTDIVHNGQTIGRVSVVASVSEVRERLLLDIELVAVMTAIAIAAALLLATRLLRGIYQPIMTLSAVARRVRESRDYSARAPVAATDELGQLCADFNAMLVEIQNRDGELESQVEQRTDELQRRNQELLDEVAERAVAEQALLASEQRFKSAFDSAAIGMIIVNEARQIQHANQAFSDMLGYTPETVVGMALRDLSHLEDRETGLYQYHELVSGQIDRYQIEKRYTHRDGHPIWVLCHISAVRDASANYQYAIGQIQDITESHQLSKELSYQATHDALTGLVNRREFEARIEYALDGTSRTGKEHAVCYLDLDQFKVINDTCGHVAGDELLRQVANVLRTKVRGSDTIARLGGDEFGLLMENCPLAQSQRVAESFRAAIEDFQFVWEDKRFRVGVSIGLVPINGESASVTEVLQQADTACYAAKDLGRNRVHIFSRDDEELTKRHGEMQWVTKIQAALETDQFRLYVQPIVPVVGDRSRYEHYEVLIRMIDESGADVPPGAFLPAAERYNLAAQVDRWVVSHLLAWAVQNPQEFARFDMCSINLSGLTLADESFLGYVIDLLRAARVPSSKICFEITETAVISNLSQASRFISTLKALGCLFALDDFGSGLSSFAYLKNLPVDYLKIDGMFVRDIFTDPLDRALVRSINDVGKVMGKKTIAEFVENDDILRVLAEVGVDYAQGYGVGKPFPLSLLDHVPEALAANR
jgi:diguanylate cyclase (GGDEF)-like protein/PAS domain S-box-containing protein